LHEIESIAIQWVVKIEIVCNCIHLIQKENNRIPSQYVVFIKILFQDRIERTRAIVNGLNHVDDFPVIVASLYFLPRFKPILVKRLTIVINRQIVKIDQSKSKLFDLINLVVAISLTINQIFFVDVFFKSE